VAYKRYLVLSILEEKGIYENTDRKHTYYYTQTNGQPYNIMIVHTDLLKAALIYIITETIESAVIALRVRIVLHIWPTIKNHEARAITIKTESRHVIILSSV
jgi:hypothetical protein